MIQKLEVVAVLHPEDRICIQTGVYFAFPVVAYSPRELEASNARGHDGLFIYACALDAKFLHLLTGTRECGLTLPARCRGDANFFGEIHGTLFLIVQRFIKPAVLESLLASWKNSKTDVPYESFAVPFENKLQFYISIDTKELQ